MILALWRASHPGPSIVVTLLAVILGVAATAPVDRVALLGLAVLLGQLSIGWSNDAIDAARDIRVARSDKPIARGDISRRAVWVAAGTALAGALALSAPLGAGFVTAQIVSIASAWAYNAWLKRTALSAVPFVVSFALLPSLATLAAVPPHWAQPWAWAAGASVGVAVHLTNVLPDLDDDAATGVRGLPHRLGARASAVVAFVAVIAGAASVAVGIAVAETGGDTGDLAWLAWAGGALVALVALAGLVLAMRGPTRTVFRLVMAAGLLLALQVALATFVG